MSKKFFCLNRSFVFIYTYKSLPHFPSVPYLSHQNIISHMQTVVKVDVSTPDYASMIKAKLLKITGKVDLDVLRVLNRHRFTYLDISEAEFGIEEIRASMNNSLFKVEVLRRFLAHIKADTILLPDDVQRRHINSAKRNKHINELWVTSHCPLFAYENGMLMNKKKTIVMFNTPQ